MTLSSKHVLRVEALKILSLLSKKRREEAALAAFCFLTENFMKNTSMDILSFASKPLEINLWPINNWLLKHKRLLLPKQEKKHLQAYKIESMEQLTHCSFTIQEPDPSLCLKVQPKEISLVLVPALYFDSHLHRIGYGKGYFDRFLSMLPHAKKWGIGFKEQKIEKIPSESHDIQLDEVFLF